MDIKGKINKHSIALVMIISSCTSKIKVYPKDSYTKLVDADTTYILDENLEIVASMHTYHAPVDWFAFLVVMIIAALFSITVIAIIKHEA